MVVDLKRLISTDSKNGLFMADWFSTLKCNLHCKHCYSNSGKAANDELTTEGAKKMMRMLSDFDVKIMLFSGGEFILRHDFEELLREADKLFDVLFLPTNGYGINRDVARALADNNIAHVQVSLDSTIPKIHNEFRGKEKAYERAINAVKTLKSYGIDVSISPVFGKFNIHEVEKFSKLATTLGCEIAFKRLIPVGRGFDLLKQEILSAEEYKTVCKKFYELKSKGMSVEAECEPLKILFDPKIQTKYKQKNDIKGGCTAGIAMIAINHRGDVYPCSKIQIKVGNVLEQNIRDIWHNSILFKRLRNRNNLKGKCAECKYISVCGGCRASALMQSKDIFAEDPLCWK